MRAVSATSIAVGTHSPWHPKLENAATSAWVPMAPTGSNIPTRNCAPKFVIRAESRAASKILTDGRSSGANNQNRAEHTMLMEQKSRELTAEMQRIAREDEQLLRDLVRLDELKQMQSGEQ